MLCGVAILFGVGSSAPAQTPSSASAPPATATSSTAPMPDYHPSFGDLMTMAVQPRHIKLALAGRRGNWNYAAYELSELRNAFARIARTIPVYRDTNTGAIMDAMTQATLTDLEQAIRAQDPARFARTYAQLTAACNACHVTLAHAMVVIKVPEDNAFADQEFAPPPP
jgi:hypothetical protein